MNTLKLLSESNDWEGLLDEHGIKVKIDPMFPYLVNACYKMTESSKTDPLVMECRGLVFDKGNFKAASRPFDRFFNYGEVPDITTKVNYENCSVQEKLDGSLINFYYSERYGTWFVSTKGTPTARNAMTKVEVDGEERGLPLLYLIADYFGIAVDYHVNRYMEYSQEYIDGGDFNTIMRLINEILDSRLSRNYTYICELVSPLNRVVKPYDTTDIVLLAIRDTDTGDYIYHHVDLFSEPTVYDCHGITDIKKAINSLNKSGDGLHEGFVITCNDTGIRVKMKTPGYVMVHHNLNSEKLSTDSLLEVVAHGEEDEVLAYFPENRDDVLVMVERRVNALKLLDKGLELAEQFDDRKTLALELKQLGVASAIFYSMKFGYTNANDVWENISLKMKVELLKL